MSIHPAEPSVLKAESLDSSHLKESLMAWPYRSYLYSYPHKMAYRELEPKLPLKQLWEHESAESLFLYMHIPFCGARCGFCNLFTLPDKRADVHLRYMDALERQAKEWSSFIPRDKPFARFAIGGGTPTLLAPDQLSRLFDIAENTMGLDVHQASISIETSPETVSLERLQILKERRVDRVSMGIQSFVDSEAAAIFRPQMPKLVDQALDLLSQFDFPLLNLDLIYGLPGQTVTSWLYSLERALAYNPGELFIYPLYTREHTIVKPEEIRRSGTDIRMECYVIARELLKSRGYIQYSMRRFAKELPPSDKQILAYSCQEEGMVGLGCGARSYTPKVHYASHYGVSRQATESIIADYVAAERHDLADYGFVLSELESRRRFVLKALLHREGLEEALYSERFGTSVLADHPELGRLVECGLAEYDMGVIRLTEEGLGYSDSIGDWLISDEVRALVEGYVMP